MFLVALPLCIGLSRASGAPISAGLIAGIVGGLLVGALSGSQLSITGPATGLVPVVLYGIRLLGSFRAFLCAVCLAGLLQIFLGLVRAGSLANLFPASVIRGMMTAIGLIMIYTQLPHLVGIDVTSFASESVPQSGTWVRPDIVAALVGLTSLALMVFWEFRMHPKYPMIPGAMLVASYGACVQSALLTFVPQFALAESHCVQLPSDWAYSLPSPQWSTLLNVKVYWVAFTLALIASLEALIAVEVVDRLDKEHRVAPPNRELMAQGVGNLVSGLLGGLPVTSVLARGSVNVNAGSSSKLASMVQGLLLLLSLMVFGPYVNRLPLACLAAVLMVVGGILIPTKAIKEIIGQGRAQIMPFAVTVVVTVATDMLMGILSGLFVAFFYILFGLLRSHGFSAEKHGRSWEIKLASEVTFFHKAALCKVFDSVQAGELIHIDGSDSRSIAYDVIEAIEEFRAGAPFRKVAVVVGGIPGISSYSEAHMDEIDSEYTQLIKNNKEWVEDKLKEDPGYFSSLSSGQTPSFLFIGCSDSRVPAESITKTDPGKLFVHRNIANIVSPTDVNLMSVLQYSVEVLKVPHIIVCGHYGCGGVRAALGNDSLGLIDQWILPIKNTFREHQDEVSLILDPRLRERRIIELHVVQQVRNLLKTSIVQRSIKHFGRPRVHGWVYDLETGLINDLRMELNPKEHLPNIFQFEFDTGEAERH